ncbi:hypothetical protein CC80DRAFT_527556 [Byssothecium circinans]|uniref:DUF7924 domain-containing protein n=1 Tax=Byssothecium circinans TaxID=147558 RepID=A0A6A5TN16_9PLEO|nr:hypothetical protein CC80DRAFT_527556 [Byssothecium circinans]
MRCQHKDILLPLQLPIDMASYREKLGAQQDRRQRSAHKGKRPQGVGKAKAQRHVRRSARLNLGFSEDTEHQHPLPANRTLCKERSREVKIPLDDNNLTAPLRKRPRTSPDLTVDSTQIDAIDHWRKEQTWPKEYFEPDTISHLLARRKSNTPSDQKQREEKTAPYQDPRYKTLLETKGSFMRNYEEGTKEEGTKEEGIKEDSKRLQQTLLGTEQNIPQASLFDDDIFSKTCDMIDGRNKAKVIQDISRLLVPSAQVSNMYFLFLTCEVKCGAAALDVADRQNAHSMTLAVRAIVELFQLVKREQELHRQVLAFSISHDHWSVRIYGYYPVIKEKDTTFYCYPIRTFDFTELEVPLLPESGLSQDLESHLSQSSMEPESLPGERGSRSAVVDAGDITTDTLFTRQGASKKSRRNAVNSSR